MKNYRQLIHDDIRNLGIADNFLGEECLYLALDILKDNPMRLCCISKSMYFDMADAMDTTTICIERNLRTFIAKLWKTDIWIKSRAVIWFQNRPIKHFLI